MKKNHEQITSPRASRSASCHPEHKLLQSCIGITRYCLRSALSSVAFLDDCLFSTDVAAQGKAVESRTISINRAPVLTLWAAVVAERHGFNGDEALTLGRALAGLNAQSKGRRLGIFKPHEEKPKVAREKDHGERFLVELCGRGVPAMNTPDGIRAVAAGKPLDPEGVETYLEVKFGENLDAVRASMRKLASSYSPAELSQQAYVLYERFRPAVAGGKSGWGARGVLDLRLIERLRKKVTGKS